MTIDRASPGGCTGGCRTGVVACGYELCPECQAGATILNREAIKNLKAERDQAIAHDRQPYPTAEAYEKVCAALEKAKTEIKQLQSNQREHDLVRQQRMELHADGLITNAEYAALASEHGGVQRLEDYDRLRARIQALESALSTRWAHTDPDCTCDDCRVMRALGIAAPTPILATDLR